LDNSDLTLDSADHLVGTTACHADGVAADADRAGDVLRVHHEHAGRRDHDVVDVGFASGTRRSWTARTP
jgi:hypothetical protein